MAVIIFKRKFSYKTGNYKKEEKLIKPLNYISIGTCLAVPKENVGKLHATSRF